jgi:hypothetical protein
MPYSSVNSIVGGTFIKGHTADGIRYLTSVFIPRLKLNLSKTTSQVSLAWQVTVYGFFYRASGPLIFFSIKYDPIGLEGDGKYCGMV